MGTLATSFPRRDERAGCRLCEVGSALLLWPQTGFPHELGDAILTAALAQIMEIGPHPRPASSGR